MLGMHLDEQDVSKSQGTPSFVRQSSATIMASNGFSEVNICICTDWTSCASTKPLYAFYMGSSFKIKNSCKCTCCHSFLPLRFQNCIGSFYSFSRIESVVCNNVGGHRAYQPQGVCRLQTGSLERARRPERERVWEACRPGVLPKYCPRVPKVRN